MAYLHFIRIGRFIEWPTFTVSELGGLKGGLPSLCPNWEVYRGAYFHCVRIERFVGWPTFTLSVLGDL